MAGRQFVLQFRFHADAAGGEHAHQVPVCHPGLVDLLVGPAGRPEQIEEDEFFELTANLGRRGRSKYRVRHHSDGSQVPHTTTQTTPRRRIGTVPRSRAGDTYAIVILPVADIPRAEPEIAMLVDFIQSAQARHGVDLAPVFEYPPGHPDNIETIGTLEGKWRPRAVSNIVDPAGGLAGFVEVLP